MKSAIVPVPAVEALVVTPEAAEHSENRRDWAMVALFGGAIVMTIVVAVCLMLLRDNPSYVFWTAMAAQLQLLLILSAFAGLLVKRALKISKSEISIVDEGVNADHLNPQDTDVVRRGDVEQEIQEAIEEIPAVNVPTEKENGSTNQPG